jgi:hypothetical protein
MGSRELAAIGGFWISLLSFSSSDFEEVFRVAGPNFVDIDDRPDITGGGNSSPSAAFLDNCLAKSDACHHSKNFSAKILVGKRIFKLPKSLGPNNRGLKIDVIPKFPPAATDFPSSKAAIA